MARIDDIFPKFQKPKWPGLTDAEKKEITKILEPGFCYAGKQQESEGNKKKSSNNK